MASFGKNQQSWQSLTIRPKTNLGEKPLEEKHNVEHQDIDTPSSPTVSNDHQCAKSEEGEAWGQGLYIQGEKYGDMVCSNLWKLSERDNI